MTGSGSKGTTGKKRTSNLDEWAKQHLTRLNPNYGKEYPKSDPEKLKKLRKESHKRYREKMGPALCMWKGARTRANRKKLHFNIEVSDIVIPEFCPVLGVRITTSNKRFTDSSPSLDRTVPALGYTKGNVHVISYKANRLKSDATPSELRQVADYLERKINNDPDEC